MKTTEMCFERGETGVTPPHGLRAPPRFTHFSGLCLLGLSMPAGALSLGAEQVTSTLGQPLRMVVPLLGDTAESLEARCFRVVTPAKADGLPVVTQARIELQTGTTPPQLIVRSNRSIEEPVIRLSIEAGCDAPIRRDYTVLLDPPSTPLAEPRAPQPSASPTPPAPAAISPSAERTQVAATDAAPPAASTSTRSNDSARTRRPATQSRQSTAAESPNAKRTPSGSLLAKAEKRGPRSPAADQLKVLASGAEASPSVDSAALAALAIPRLRISDELGAGVQPGAVGSAAAPDELQAAIAKDRRARLLSTPIDSDIAPRLEADLVVAQRRLAELQAQLSGAAASTTAGAPGAAAIGKSATAASASAEAAKSGINWLSWAWIPGLALVAGLVGFLLLQRRRQKPAPFDAQLADSADINTDDERFTPLLEPQVNAPITVLRPTQLPETQPKVSPATEQSNSGAAAAVSRPNSVANPIIATRAEREASDRLNNPLFQLRDTESHVDVSELSQVTEEAQVYADLGRNDQAIELLRHHIDTQSGERSSPAPWLMIFELYRRTNNRAGYNELAPQFRLLFNGRVPDWDNYGHELALDDGLEAFPHLVARIERDWGTAEARKFLEELLYDNRGGSRLGFSLAAYRDILLLLQVHEGLGVAPDFATSDWESRGANDSDGTPKWDLALEMIEPPKPGELESFFARPPATDKH